MKPTRFASSATGVLKELGKRCSRQHQHVQLLSGRAAGAAVYPPGLCRAILKGIDQQLHREGRHTPVRVANALASGTAIYALQPDESMLPEGELDEAHIVDEDAALAAYGAEVVQQSPEGEQAS